MIETTTTTTTTNKQTNPKIICSAVHLSKKSCTKRYKHIITKENYRKRCQCEFWKIDYAYFLEVCRIF